MILEPSIDVLQKQINSKYTLATLSAKRARQLLDTQDPLVDDSQLNKPVSVALEEIHQGKIYVKKDDE